MTKKNNTGVSCKKKKEGKQKGECHKFVLTKISKYCTNKIDGKNILAEI